MIFISSKYCSLHNPFIGFVPLKSLNKRVDLENRLQYFEEMKIIYQASMLYMFMLLVCLMMFNTVFKVYVCRAITAETV
jgi:hypothetical protein